MEKDSDDKQKTMNDDMIDDEVLSDSLSIMSSRRESVMSSHMLNINTRSRRGSSTRRRTSITQTHENKQVKQQIPAKVLVFNGKCSEIFKSTLEDCVEDCILEFPGENSVYVSKPGQGIAIPTGSKQASAIYSRENSFNTRQSARSHQRKSSANQSSLLPVTGLRTNQPSNLSLANTALSATAITRIRHQLGQQRFSAVDNISEEAADCQVPIQQIYNPVVIELDSEQPHLTYDEIMSHPSNFDPLSRTPSPAHRKFPPTSTYKSYRDRQKDYLLSDLVMLGPEYFTHVFNLPRTSRYRTQTSTKPSPNTEQRYNKTVEKYNELDQIKQDLFHRYLWTQNPQVSCRLRPISTYTRSTTSVI